MRIKKDNYGNEYINQDGIWIRNFTKDISIPVCLSSLYDKSDYELVIQNEEKNKNYPKISEEKIYFEKVLIVSDGYQFQKKKEIIKQVNKNNVCILAANGALKSWDLFPDVTINAYVINNPYRQSLSYLPSSDSYYPTCISSSRTYYEFNRRYPGDIYIYIPPREAGFGLSSKETYYVDDYRNPICACLILAYHFGAEKIVLFCCDDSFEQFKPGAVALDNGLYTYPHHILAQNILDANMWWMKRNENRKIEVADFSSGKPYKNAHNLKDETEFINFINN